MENGVKILIAYGTSEGQTRKIAEAAAARVREHGHDAKLFDTAGSPANLNMDDYDKIVVAASVHQKRHQDSVEVFVTAKLVKLQKPTLFISVSLSAAFSEGLPEAQSYLDAFFKSTGWKPTQSLLVAGALRYDEYDYFKQQIIEHVVLKGHNVDERKGDYEFTDWDSVFRAIDFFIHS
jgi:menaquinone-dependent protoporphyrinogen oxidase